MITDTRVGRSRVEIVALALVLLLAAHLRVVAVLETRVIEPVRADAGEYYRYALNLRALGVYSRTDPPAAPVPDAVRRPGYPLFLVPFVTEPPTATMLLRIGNAQAALGVLLVALTAELGRRMLRPAGGIAAATLAALSPHLVNASIWMLSEALFALLVLLALVVALDARGRVAGSARVFAAAAILGLAMLARATLDYFPLVLVAALLIGIGPPHGRRIAALTVAGVLCVLSPWLVRNAITLGEASDGTLALATLHHGMYPDFKLDGREETLGMPYRFDRDAPPPGAGAGTLLAELRRRAAADPALYLHWYLIGKPLSLFAWNEVRIGDAFILHVTDTPYFRRPEFLATHWISRVLHWPLVVLSAVGAILAWTRRQPIGLATAGPRLLSLLLGYVLLVHVVGAPYPRYSVPFRPETYLLALFALTWLLAWRRGRLERAMPVPA